MQQKNQVYFVAVILKVLLVNLLLTAPNFTNTFCKNKKNVWKIKKNVKNVKT